MAKYISTKRYREIAPCAYRQWKADSDCNLIHGYCYSFYFEFESDDLDARNWVVDFGSLRPLKELLEEWFDHTLLCAESDPHKEDILKLGELGLAKITMVEKTGCEGLAEFIYDYVNNYFLKDHGYSDRVWCSKVEVIENGNNSAMRVGHRP